MSEERGNQYAAHQQGLSAMFKRAARGIQNRGGSDVCAWPRQRV